MDRDERAELLERILALFQGIDEESSFRLRFLGSYGRNRSEASMKWKTQYVAGLNEAVALADALERELDDLLGEEVSEDAYRTLGALREQKMALIGQLEDLLKNLERLRGLDEAAEWQR